jgi:hypothetical protein
VAEPRFCRPCVERQSHPERFGGKLTPWSNSFQLTKAGHPTSSGSLKFSTSSWVTMLNGLTTSGSTSIPGLASKEVIDVQITAADEATLGRIAATLDERGRRRVRGFGRDHQVPGLPSDPAEWRKAFFDEPMGERPHPRPRTDRRPSEPPVRTPALRLPPRASGRGGGTSRTEAEARGAHDRLRRLCRCQGPLCDLIYFAAEAWARNNGWSNDGVEHQADDAFPGLLFSCLCNRVVIPRS